MSTNSSAKNAYRSMRLYYKRVQKDDAHFMTVFQRLMGDPTIRILTDDMLLCPIGPVECDGLINGWTKALLGVAICLLPQDLSELDAKGQEEKPVIIGEMTVGEGGIHASVAHNRHASLGISLLPEYQNQGYGGEAIDWALNWSFRYANLHTVSVTTVSHNKRAAALYEKMGFVAEGRKRQTVWLDRQWYDELLFSMTEDEWEARLSIAGSIAGSVAAKT